MELQISAITTRKSTRLFEQALIEFVSRLSHYGAVDQSQFAGESSMEKAIYKTSSRTTPKLILLDSRGKLLSSEQFASWIGQQRDSGAQHLVFAVGPADGWSQDMRDKADLLLSFGPMTFPHELARVMLAEQLYRAFTILAGHPYHAGH